MRFAALLVCCLGVLPAKAATVGDPVASRSAEAQAHYEAGRYDEALRAYRDALVERPESGALHLNVGDALYQLGDYENALQEFERAAAAEETDLAARAFYNKGNTHFQLQDYAAAAEAYKQSLERSPEDIDAKANLELALRLLQTPPPQEGGQDTQESEDSGDQQQQDQSSEGDPSEAEDESESQAGDDESEDEQTPEGQQNDAADEGEDENTDSADEDQAQTDESAPMDEKEAEQLLDALNDRDAQSQQRRYRAKRRGDDKQDW